MHSIGQGTLDSIIVKGTIDRETLSDWVSECFSEPVFKLLYRGARDGYKAENFHSKCDNQGATLTIIKSVSGPVFGGFTTCSWEKTTEARYQKDPIAFIFHLTKSQKLNQQLNDNSICSDPNFGPIFGNQIGYGYDIAISNEWNKNACLFFGDYTYKLPEGAEVDTFFTDSENCMVEEIEVFSVKKRSITC